jgi:hypothetical protein
MCRFIRTNRCRRSRRPQPRPARLDADQAHKITEPVGYQRRHELLQGGTHVGLTWPPRRPLSSSTWTGVKPGGMDGTASFSSLRGDRRGPVDPSDGCANCPGVFGDTPSVLIEDGCNDYNTRRRHSSRNADAGRSHLTSALRYPRRRAPPAPPAPADRLAFTT